MKPAKLVLALALFTIGPRVARAVPAGVDGSTETFIGCTPKQIESCYAMQGGTPVHRGSACYCDIYYWVPRQVSNAKNGDVGLVPMAGNSGGETLVREVMGALGQLHRHAVMFHERGAKVRHNTMYAEEIGTIEPLIGEVRLDEGDLRNGLPGALTQSIDAAYGTGRVANEGLVLKPMWESIGRTNLQTGVTTTTDYRALFNDAVELAKATPAYYKLSDYTEMVSMSLPYRTTRNGDLRGTHCAGYVHWAFTEVGFELATFVYDEQTRLQAGRALHRAARALVDDETTWLVDVLKPNADENIANQITNCFAGMDCGSLERDWEDPGPGEASSPDNLLPVAFTLRGSRNYAWDGRTKAPGARVDNAAGVAITPFQRVEAQVMAGGYYVQESRSSWPGDGTPP